LKHVLHNWDDARALALLQQCARSLPADGQLLVIEAILAADERADMAAMLDVEMLVLTGGRERRRPELRRLLQTAGYRIERMAPLTRHTWLLVCGHSGVRLHSAHIAPGSP
jgi:hypothetical protein